jgi:hypothetical protein
LTKWGYSHWASIGLLHLVDYLYARCRSGVTHASVACPLPLRQVSYLDS